MIMNKVKSIIDKKFGTDITENNTRMSVMKNGTMIVVNKNNDSINIEISDCGIGENESVSILELKNRTKTLLMKTYSLNDIEQIQLDIESIQL